MKNLLSSISVAIGILMAACSNKAHEVWVATKSTPVYASESDTEEKVLFTLVAGDACSPLRSVVMKAYLHTEIQCKKGRGWVVDKQNFDIKPVD
ncbi:hypothetical protein FAZ69_30340 [Trinickia terrae]|uniref:Lipoprotein n=1 Tax=Trinickia terrae TaxID=2571161 RepID=A0A4U1HJ25_9BURK|nr:hypothetical protein [Trinickia terrae]TKC79908.1 hypothetical protein FAZ69_30340 [Trinickia terrae]